MTKSCRRKKRLTKMKRKNPTIIDEFNWFDVICSKNHFSDEIKSFKETFVSSRLSSLTFETSGDT